MGNLTPSKGAFWADAAKLTYPMNIMSGIGTTLLICFLLYAIPRTCVS